MRTLSKSKLLAYRQCSKRLWLEVHHPELRSDSSATQASFNVGHQVGDIARQLYDPNATGELIEFQTEGFEAAFVRTQSLLKSCQPIFEASFRIEGSLALADVMLPQDANGKISWRMVEVKSSTSVKSYHRDDAAVQAYVAKSAGVELSGIALAHIDSGWVYPGNGDYQGLLRENDLTEEAFARADEVKGWINDAQVIVASNDEPVVSTGEQCGSPYECGFLKHCRSSEPQATQPVNWLPGRFSNRLAEYIDAHSVIELSEVPDNLLSKQQLRVKAVTLSGQTYFDQEATVRVLAEYELPAYFMDFETIQFTVPIWEGTRPYQQIPFQFSVHKLASLSALEQSAFLDLSGNDPSLGFAEALIEACGTVGPIFVYNAGFETARIRELVKRFPDMSVALLALNERVVDLLPVARQHYYHPSQHGSWSIKKVLPALCPDLNYSDLEGVQDGGMAQTAFLEAISLEANSLRKAELEKQLLAYCALDTYAMVRLWSVFTNQVVS